MFIPALWVFSAQVLGLYEDLPQHLLNCLSTNHLSPVASNVYKELLQLQRKAWTADQGEAPEDELAEKWAVAWLPTLSRALTSPLPFLQSNAANYLLVWTLRIFPAAYPLLAQSFCGQDLAELRAWVTLLSVQKTITGVLPTDKENLERLSSCLFSKEENVRLGALSLLCSSPRTNQALSQTELRLLKEFLLLNLNCDSSSFRQLLQASVRKALVRLRDSSLASLRRQVPNKESLAGGDSQRPLAEAVGKWTVPHILGVTKAIPAAANVLPWVSFKAKHLLYTQEDASRQVRPLVRPPSILDCYPQLSLILVIRWGQVSGNPSRCPVCG